MANRRYEPEFKAEAIRMVLDEYMSPEDVAERLGGVPSGTVSAWASGERTARRKAAELARKQAAAEVENLRTSADQERGMLRARVIQLENALDQIETVLTDSADLLSKILDGTK